MKRINLIICIKARFINIKSGFGNTKIAEYLYWEMNYDSDTRFFHKPYREDVIVRYFPISDQKMIL